MIGLRTSRIARFGRMQAAKQAVWNPGLPLEPRVIALYRFEKGPHFTDDSRGGNDLTNHGATESAVRCERKWSSQFVAVSSQYMDRADADLDVGFPGKAGGTLDALSILAYVRVPSTTAHMGVVCKHASFALYIYRQSATQMYIIVYVWKNGTPHEVNSYINAADFMGVNKWYHIAWTQTGCDDTDTYRLSVYDVAAGAEHGNSPKTGNWLNDYAGDVNANAFQVGRYNPTSYRYMNGLVDELVIANAVFTPGEITLIRAGKFKYP